MTALRLLVAGAGANVWTLHQPGVQAIGAEVVAVHDPDPDGARRAAERHGCPVATSLDALLAHDADLVVVTAPHVHHAEIALRALDAGFHVLVEKPLAVTVGDADAMVAAARRARRLLAVCLQQRTRTEVEAARRLIADGVLGRLQRVELVASWPRRTSYFATGPWRASWAGEGGGILINQGQHDLDVLCRLVGAPDRVVAATSSDVHGLEVEDTAAALLHWRGGALGSAHLTSAADDERQRIEVVGTAGRLRLRPGTLTVWRAAEDFSAYAAAPGDPYAPPAPAVEETLDGAGGTFVELYRNLAAALAGEAPLVAPAEDARVPVEVANAIVMSAHGAGAVALPLERAGYQRLLDELRTHGTRTPEEETDGSAHSSMGRRAAGDGLPGARRMRRL